MRVARIDLTWGPLPFQARMLDHLEEAMRLERTLVCVMVDTLGRQLLVRRRYVMDGDWPRHDDCITFTRGQRVVLTSRDDAEAGDGVLPIACPRLHEILQPGGVAYVGRFMAAGIGIGASDLWLTVQAVNGCDVECVAHNDAAIGGLAVVHVASAAGGSGAVLPLLSAYDQDMLQVLSARYTIHFVGLSSVRSGSEVAAARAQLAALGLGSAGVVAKLEGRAALAGFGAILEEADGVVLSRGYLGLEVEPEKMAAVQKAVITAANLVGKPVVVSRLVDSMADAPRPTRAEATDVANAVLDGADALQLGAETLRGRHPVESVATLAAIARQAEVVFDSAHHHEFLLRAAIRAAAHQRSALRGSSSAGGSPLASTPTSDDEHDAPPSARWGTGGPDAQGLVPQRRSRLSHTISDTDLADRGGGAGSEAASPTPDVAGGAGGAASATSAGALRASSSLSARPAPQSADGDAHGWHAAHHGPHHHHHPNSHAHGQHRPPHYPHALGQQRRSSSHADLATSLRTMVRFSDCDPSGNALDGSPHHWYVHAQHTQHHHGHAPHAPRSGSGGGGGGGGSGPFLTPGRLPLPGGAASLVAAGASLASPRSAADADEDDDDDAGAGPYLSRLEAITSSAVRVAEEVGAALIVCVTASATAPALLSKYRPHVPIYALVVPRLVNHGTRWRLEGREVAGRCLLLRGVVPVLAAPGPGGGSALDAALALAARRGLTRGGSHVVVVERLGRTFGAKVVQMGAGGGVATRLDSVGVSGVRARATAFAATADAEGGGGDGGALPAAASGATAPPPTIGRLSTLLPVSPGALGRAALATGTPAVGALTPRTPREVTAAPRREGGDVQAAAGGGEGEQDWGGEVGQGEDGEGPLVGRALLSTLSMLGGEVFHPHFVQITPERVRSLSDDSGADGIGGSGSGSGAGMAAPRPHG